MGNYIFISLSRGVYAPLAGTIGLHVVDDSIWYSLPTEALRHGTTYAIFWSYTIHVHTSYTNHHTRTSVGRYLLLNCPGTAEMIYFPLWSELLPLEDSRDGGTLAIHCGRTNNCPCGDIFWQVRSLDRKLYYIDIMFMYLHIDAYLCTSMYLHVSVHR